MATKLDEAVLLEGLAHFLDAPDAKLRVRHSYVRVLQCELNPKPAL
jgi:hypothetical protein